MNDSGSGADGEEQDRTHARVGRERERKRQERRARVMARHPRIGWLLLALAGAQAYDESPRPGADGRSAARDRGQTPRGSSPDERPS